MICNKRKGGLSFESNQLVTTAGKSRAYTYVRRTTTPKKVAEKGEPKLQKK